MTAQIETNREALLKVANLVRPALASQSYIPSLTHICFDGVSAIAYNDITAIMVRSPIEIEGCLPGDLLIKALNSLTAEKVLIQSGDAGNLLLSSGRSKLKIPTLPITDFPFETPPDSESPIVITADIIKGIELCLIAVGNDPTHPAQMGITMEADKNGVTLYTTDNFTVSRYESTSMAKLPADIPVILPTFFCQQLVLLSKAFPDEQIEFGIHAGSLVVSFGDQAKLFTKQLLDLEPMDFASILTKYGIDKVDTPDTLVIPDDFDAAFGRALLVLGNDPDKVTKVTVTDGRMKLLSTSTAGEATDSFPYKDPDASGEPFFIDPVLVSRAAKVCGRMVVLERVLVLTNGDLSFVHMIAHCVA